MTQTNRYSTFGRLFFSQWLGNGILLLLAGALLQSVDARGSRVALYVLAVTALAVSALCFYIATFRGLRPCALRPPWLLACLMLATLLALWWLTLQPIAVGRAHEQIVSAYFTAQFPEVAGLHYRYNDGVVGHPFGYSGMVARQERLYEVLQYLLAGFWLPLAVEMCACGLAPGWLLRALRVYRRVPYWLCILLMPAAALSLTWSLTQSGWPDSPSLANSVTPVSRLIGAYTLDILLWCLLLVLIAHYLAATSAKVKALL